MTNIFPKYMVEPFGSLKITEENPRVQFDAVYGNRVGIDVESVLDLLSSGSIGVNDATVGYEYYASSGTNANGYAIVQSKKGIRYRAGQGATSKFTSRFVTPVTNNEQFGGILNVGNQLGFGYDINKKFGIWYRAGGRVEIRTLTISAGAGGAETATVTLNGTAKTVSVTSGTTKHGAFQIGATSFPGWTVVHNGSTVVFVSTTIGAKAGTFSLSSTGTLAGTFARTQAGQDYQIDKHIPQDDWNIAKLNASISAGPFILNPLVGNVFSVGFQYLGYGSITFFVEDVNTGEFIPVHTILNAGYVTAPTMGNPTFKVGLSSKNIGSTTDVKVYGASGSGFVHGKIQPFRNPSGAINSKTGVGTSFTNIISIRVRTAFNGRLNLSEVFPFLAGISTDGTKPGEFQLILNPTFAGEPDWTYKDSTNSTVEYDTVGTTVTNGTIIGAIPMPKAGDSTVSLIDYDIRLAAGDVLCLAGRATSGTTDITTSIMWLED